MIVEILSTGDEIRSGATADTNAAHIADVLETAGIPVLRHTCVGDDMDMLTAMMIEIGERADAAVVTGGLGPTEDDLTSPAAAKASGSALVLNEQALAVVERFFTSRGRPMSESNRKQALLPENADVIPNPVGTAPGFSLKIGKCVFFFMPGVPYEMKRMLSDHVMSGIAALKEDTLTCYKVQSIATLGLPESVTGEKLHGIEDVFPGIHLGLRAKFPEIHVRLYAKGKDAADLENLLTHATAWVREKLGNTVFSTEGLTMEEVVGQLLKEKKDTVAAAESCTGGLIAHRLTNVSGSSDYFLFSGVTYSNEAKIGVLNVSADTIETYGAVSEETVREMAAGAKQVSGADYGLSTSGIAGPDGGTDEKPVGTVCIGLATPETVKSYRYVLPFPGRLMNKRVFAMTALDRLRRELMGV